MRSFKERNVRIFFGGLAISHAGTWAQLTTVILLVRSLGGGGLELGIITACQFLPLLLLGLYAGAVADRIDRHRTTMQLQATMGLHALALASVDFLDLESIPVLYGMTLILGTLTAFENPTRRTMITELVPSDQLANVLSLSTSVMTGSRIFGPAAGALVAGLLGTGWVFLLNGATFLVFLFAMKSMDQSKFHLLKRAKKSATPIRDGLTEVWSDPVLRVTIVSFALVSTFSFNTSVQIPLLITDRLGEEDSLFGYLLSALSVGNVIGSLLVARLVVVSHRCMYASGALLAITMTAFSFATSTIVAFILVVPMGIGLTSFLNSSNVIVQQRTRPEIRSRVLALLGVIFLGSTPIGGPITGVIGDLYGAVWANLYGALVAGAVSLVAVLLLKRITGSFNPTESVQ
ncbi:MAG: MFS transporter [Acidimicrobiia bacterium]|nr:MFS transporter [Acidimicrobiia bacterium]